MKNLDRLNICKIVNLANFFPGRIRARVEKKANRRMMDYVDKRHLEPGRHPAD
jgi:hypothetical protein